ncbi:MAG: hypothetical protein ACI9MB_002682 [Verrucomicrobiales bacterium]|jgi:hypothetical protein
MKTTTILTSVISLLSLPLASAVTIIVGDDGNQIPAGPTANLDGAIPMIIVDYQANLYTNSSGSAEAYSLGNFNFYAQGNGDVTPFVALLTGAGTAVGDYDILAIGTTRIGGGTDFTAGGIVNLPFGGSPLISVPNGATLVGGFQQGTSNGNVIPFNINSGLSTFITGGGAGTDTSAISVGGDITAGASTWSSLSGGRNYEFIIEATSVPEPSTTLLIPAALGGLLMLRRRR